MAIIKFSIIPFIFLLSLSLAYSLGDNAAKNMVIAVDFLGIIIGIVFTVFMMFLLQHFKNTLRNCFKYIMYGVILQLLALVYTLVFVRFKAFQIPGGIDVHHLLMILGIICFAIATYNLNKLVSEIQEKEK